MFRNINEIYTVPSPGQLQLPVRCLCSSFTLTGRQLSRLHSSLMKIWNEFPGLGSHVVLLLDKKEFY